MACTIKYNGFTFTEEEFNNYLESNIQEFADLLPSEMGEDVNSTKFIQPLYGATPEVKSTVISLAENIVGSLSPEIKNEISNKYGVEQDLPEFNTAISREVVGSLFNNKRDEVYEKSIQELLKTFSTLTKEEIDNLDGLERKLYNITTEQRTRFKPYPSVKPSEVAISTPEGGWVTYTREELKQKVRDNEIELEEDSGIIPFLTSEMIFENQSSLDPATTINYNNILNDKDKTELTKKLLKVLEKLGFSTLKLSDYIKTFKGKHGIDPSVNALADMVNRVVAIAEGGNIEELLTEEVSHLLTETYNNQDEIRSILPEVEGTDLWAQHSGHYFSLYEGQGLTGELLTEKVRREILGKLIAEKISELNPGATGIFERISNVVSNFFNSIRNFLRPSIKSNLDTLTDTIAKSLLEESKIEDMYSSDNLVNNPFTEFYNASDSSLTSQLNNLVRDSRKLLAKNKRGALSNKVDSLATNVARGNLDTYQSLRAVAQYLDIVNSVKRNVHTKIKKYDEAVANGQQPKVFLNSVDAASVNILTTENLPKLQVLQATVKDISVPSGMDVKTFEFLRSRVKDNIESLIADINTIKGEVTLRNSQAGTSLIEDMTREYNLSEAAAQEVANYMVDTYNDIGTLQMFFGNLQHAPNPILALFGRLIGDIHHKTDVATKQYTRGFINKLEGWGIPQEKFQSFFDKVIQRTGDNKLTGYLNSVIDWGKFENSRIANEIEAYNIANQIYINEVNAKGPSVPLVYTPITDLKEIGSSDNTPRTSSFSGVAKEQYNNHINAWRDENLEQPYSTSFRQTRENMINDIRTNGITLPSGTVVNEIPNEVLDMMAGWASVRREIKAPYTKNGVVDYSQISEAEKADLEAVKRERLEAKSLVSGMTGEFKTGDELKVALALQAIEQYYIQNNTNASGVRSVKPAFIDKLKSFTSNTEAFEWFIKNTGITFNDNFWKNLNTVSASTGDKFRNTINAANILPTEKADALLKVDELESLMNRRSQFLKQFKNTSSPAEVDTLAMGKDAKELYISMEQTIEDLFRELNVFMQASTGTTVNNPLETESTANEAFERDFQEFMDQNPNSDIVKFAKLHTTENNFRSISEFRNGLKKFIQTGSLPISKAFLRNAAVQLNLDPASSSTTISLALSNYLSTNGNFDQLITNHTKSKLAGYYKRFAPKGFTNFYNMLKSGNIQDKNGNSYTLGEIAQIIREGNTSNIPFENNIVSMLSLNPEAEWMEDANGLTENPYFIKDIEGVSTNYAGYGQPRFDKYRNDKFINDYSIDLNLYFSTGETKSQGTTAEKQKELSLLEFLVHSRYNNFNQQGLGSQANAYSLPGVRQESVAKSKNFMKNPVRATKEWYKDFIDNSVDKKIFGETASGEIDNDPSDISRLVVPTLNVQPLENLQDTSIDLLHSYSTHTYNANMYENRQDALTKANQLESILLARDFKNKTVANSNTYKAFNDFKKAYILGVQETQRIKIPIGTRHLDLTSMLRSFDKVLGTVNVGLNPAISVTAATSALTFTATETLVGQYINTSSFKKGVSRFHEKAGSFLGQSGEINKTNEVYVFGERFGLFNILNGVQNSGESRYLRELFSDGVGGMPHVITELLTKPFMPSIMYANLDNHRFVPDMGITSFEKFTEDRKAKKLTSKEIKDEWRRYEENSVLNNMSLKDGMIEYSPELRNNIENLLGPDVVDDYIQSIELDIRNMITTTLSKVDAKMPMYDKSMASRNALARFLLRHREWFTINVQNRFKRKHNNMYTGQTEEGHYHTMARYLWQTIKAFDPRNDNKLREIFEDLEPYEKMNLKRVLLDTAISVVLVAFGALVVAPWDDDDENKDSFTVNFLAYMYYRLASEQMSSGLTGVPAYKDVAESPFVAMNSIKELMKPSNWSLDEVETGPYEGHSKLYKLAMKNTFGRHYFDLVHGLEKKSDFYRLNNEWTLWFMGKTSQKEKEERRKYEEELRDSFINKNERFMR